jgi:hypothetical protein
MLPTYPGTVRFAAVVAAALPLAGGVSVAIALIACLAS